MIEVQLELKNGDGLHARPAGIIAKAASQFQAKVEVSAKGQSKNAKSVMSLLTLGLERGDAFALRADGPDEEAAVNHLKSVIESQLEV